MVSSKLIAGIIVIGVLSLLIFSGPAEAYILSLTGTNTDVLQGEKINFIATVDNQMNNEAPINYITLKLTGDKTYSCDFDIQGLPINENDCKGITIVPLSNNSGSCSYGYNGYGYSGTCNLKFNITLDSNKFGFGEYETKLIVKTTKSIEETLGPIISISKKLDNICSIRAKDGQLIFNNKIYSNVKTNFFIPYDGKIKGEGYISAERGKERFLYKFKVTKLLENTANVSKVEISGYYKLGMGPFNGEKAILTYDRKHNTVTITGNKLYVAHLEINFRRGCDFTKSSVQIIPAH